MLSLPPMKDGNRQQNKINTVRYCGEIITVQWLIVQARTGLYFNWTFCTRDRILLFY